MPPFIVEPKAGPTPVEGPLAARSAAADARAKAIAILSGGQVQEQREAVANPNKISVEEMSAVTRTSQSQGQQGTVEASDSSEESDSAASQASQGQPAPEDKAAKSPTDEKKQLLSAQYAQLARKEQALRAREMALKAKEEALKAQEQPRNIPQHTQQEDAISKADLLKDPFGTLAKLGLSYQQLTEQAVNAPSQEQIALQQVIDELRGELRAVKQGQDETRKTLEESQTRSYNQALNQISNEVKALVASDPEFEMVHATGSQQDVVDLIKETFDKDGVLLSVEEAAKQVEEFLLEEALKLQKVSKLQKRLQTSSTAPKEGDSKQPTVDANKPAGNAPRTLSNTMGSTRQLSARDRAVLAMQGKLTG
jgi:hypothetical protein